MTEALFAFVSALIAARVVMVPFDWITGTVRSLSRED